MLKERFRRWHFRLNRRRGQAQVLPDEEVQPAMDVDLPNSNAGVGADTGMEVDTTPHDRYYDSSGSADSRRPLFGSPQFIFAINAAPFLGDGAMMEAIHRLIGTGLVPVRESRHLPGGDAYDAHQYKGMRHRAERAFAQALIGGTTRLRDCNARIARVGDRRAAIKALWRAEADRQGRLQRPAAAGRNVARSRRAIMGLRVDLDDAQDVLARTRGERAQVVADARRDALAAVGPLLDRFQPLQTVGLLSTLANADCGACDADGRDVAGAVLSHLAAAAARAVQQSRQARDAPSLGRPGLETLAAILAALDRDARHRGRRAMQFQLDRWLRAAVEYVLRLAGHASLVGHYLVIVARATEVGGVPVHEIVGAVLRQLEDAAEDAARAGIPRSAADLRPALAVRFFFAGALRHHPETTTPPRDDGGCRDHDNDDTRRRRDDALRACEAFARDAELLAELAVTPRGQRQEEDDDAEGSVEDRLQEAYGYLDRAYWVWAECLRDKAVADADAALAAEDAAAAGTAFIVGAAGREGAPSDDDDDDETRAATTTTTARRRRELLRVGGVFNLAVKHLRMSIDQMRLLKSVGPNHPSTRQREDKLAEWMSELSGGDGRQFV